MAEQDLNHIWQNSSSEERIEINYSQLIDQMKTKMDLISKEIKNRDRREIAASLVGIAAYSWIGWQIPFIWSKIACILLICWFVFIIFRLKKQRKNEHATPIDSISSQLEQRKKYFQDQAKMLNSVFWWYVLPPITINIMLFFGVGNPTEWDSFFARFLPNNIVEKVIIVCLLLAFGYYIVRLNKKAVKKELEPLISEIEETQRQLNE